MPEQSDDLLAKDSSEQAFDAVERELARLEEERRLDVPELLLKGRAIQLASGTGPYSLNDARNAFEEILRRDPSNVPALLNLGWFLFAVEDDARAALPRFEAALAACRKDLAEARRGIAECRAETQSEDDRA